MSVAAKKLPPHTAVLWIIGFNDALVKLGKEYAFDSLPQNPKSKYVEIGSNHFRTPMDGLEHIVSWVDSIAAQRNFVGQGRLICQVLTSLQLDAGVDVTRATPSCHSSKKLAQANSRM